MVITFCFESISFGTCTLCSDLDQLISLGSSTFLPLADFSSLVFFGTNKYIYNTMPNPDKIKINTCNCEQLFTLPGMSEPGIGVIVLIVEIELVPSPDYLVIN